VLLIFLIVLGVIAKWVVPPVSEALAAREAMLAKTAADTKLAVEQVAAAEADYEDALGEARTEASAIRDEARTAGRKAVDESRAAAGAEVSNTVAAAGAELSKNAEAASTELDASVDGLSRTLADRILGLDGAAKGGSR
ncbi:MAG TPA: F0F1 ATP synthase subunit B, partial [Mycolicibacterium fallax]|nr:F0F1 ATP synthase subunit B [Mycolicibacterium fallax]